MVEAAVPTIQSMHLLSVVNFIHASCIAKVKNDNILKRDQSLSYWSQVHSNSKRSTTERHLQGPGDSFLSDVYEESISTKTQGLIVLPKVSITMLQSSIVEEIISVAALDNVQVSQRYMQSQFVESNECFVYRISAVSRYLRSTWRASRLNFI